VAKTVVLTGVGRDRVGIVAEVTELLYKLGCNLLDSSMTLLRGEFAIILMVQLPLSQTLDQLRGELDTLEQKMGLNISVRELDEVELENAVVSGTPHMISVYGADKPGIVAGITRKLADMGINITDVETKFTDDREKGVFVMILEVILPVELPTRAVESALDEISSGLGVDLSVQALEVYDL